MRRERRALASRLALLVALASLLYAVAKPASGSGARLPRCAPEGYGLEQKPLFRQARPQRRVKLTVGWVTATERRRACLLKTTIRLTIVGSGGAAVTARWHVRAVLEPWSGVVHTWIWRNWCETGRHVEARVAFSLPRGRSVSQLVPAPPRCVQAGAASTVTDLGTGTKYVQRPGDRIPPHILPKGTPPPLHEALINPRNAWLVSDGYTLVAVYAGSPGDNASIGRFAIIRQNEIFGVQYAPPDIVDVGKVGAIRITRAPTGASKETAAQRGKLAFVSTDGTRGVLELTGDRVRVLRT
jgi:hypothetical protein